MNALFEGVLLGLTLAFIFGFGPAFFALIQTAVHRGFFAGVMLAFGIFLNDLVIVILGLLGSVNVIGGSENFKLLGIIGGSVLVIFGIVTYGRKATVKEAEEKENGEPHRLIYVAKGFLLNLTNPFVWIFWISVVVSATASYKADTYDLTLFFSGILGVVLITDVLKVFTASRLTRFLTDKFLIMINKIAGTALFIFGLFLVFRAIYQF